MFNRRIQSGPRLVNEQATIRSFVAVMKEMGWSWEELMDTPITVYSEVVSELNRQAKEHERAMKKAKR